MIQDGVFLVDLRCPECGKTGTQELKDLREWSAGKMRRVRVDTVCACGKRFTYSKLVARKSAIMIFQDDFFDLSF